MKEFINTATITGKLVKNDLKESTTNAGDECIKGSLILRTADESEHTIDFFTMKYKKDANKNPTSELTFFYDKYSDIMYSLKDMEHCSADEQPDVLSIRCRIGVTDYYKNDKVNTYNKIYGSFITKVEPKDYETTILEAKYEVEGLVESITEEIKNDTVTGNLIVKLNAISQRAINYVKGKETSYEVDSLIPITMKVGKEMATAFKSGGYYDGCWAKFIGNIVNTVISKEVREKQAFGKDKIIVVKDYDRNNYITSGNAPSTLYDHDLTDEMVTALIAKRKQHLEEVKSNTQNNSSGSAFPTNTAPSPAPAPNFNPFAAKQ